MCTIPYNRREQLVTKLHNKTIIVMMTSEQKLHNDEYRLFQVGLCPVNTSYECKYYDTRFDVTYLQIRSNNLHQLSCDLLVQNIDLLRKSHVTSTFYVDLSRTVDSVVLCCVFIFLPLHVCRSVSRVYPDSHSHL